MGYCMVIKNILIAVAICFFQVVVVGVCIGLYLLTNAAIAIFIIPIIEIISFLLLKKYSSLISSKNIFYAWLISLLLFICVAIYMLICQSYIGFSLAIFIYLFGFGIGNAVCMLMELIKRRSER